MARTLTSDLLTMRLDFIATVILLVLLIYVLNAPIDEEGDKQAGSVSAFAQDYDYFMTDLQTMIVDRGQAPHYSLRADKFTHYSKPEHSLLESPNVLIYKNAAPRWHITSQRGRIEPALSVSGKKLELGGNVVVRWHEPDKEELNIYTEQLTIYPDAKRFRTNKQVTIVIKDSRLVATGMEGDLNTDRVELLADVKGHYDEKQPE